MTCKQSTDAVVMIRPCRFYPNPETAADNAFQRTIGAEEADMVSGRARAEFDDVVERMREAGITVHVFDDTPKPEKPDAIFPNNWFSTHHDGRVVLYPMYSPARRRERRRDIIEAMRKTYRVNDVIDYSGYEERGRYLEGTGSLVLDHVHRVAYVSLSKRADREPLERFCADFDFEPVVFESFDVDQQPIYHTNVMMCVATDFALAGLDLIPDSRLRARVQARLAGTGKTVISLNQGQIANFAGNALELDGKQGKLLVLSTRAVASLTRPQRDEIERHAQLLPLSLPTIELAGGSARCLMASIYLPHV
jgi:hypothetical protein